MVTKIISGQSIRGLLLYNESKVADKEAKLIMASRFGAELDRLDFDAKLARFEHLTFLKPNVKTNAIHIMLNFDRDDKLEPSILQQIASSYMNKIGFGEQPFLVYQHQDANHPHLHIVTTNINADGERMDIHGIGRTVSETARKELEIEYGLVKAEGRQKSEALAIPPVDIEKVIYGKMPTKRAINNVVSAIMRSYKFTSLAEYNAILKQFNITADRGKEETVMFEKRGLVYSIIDQNGKRIGIPFKASQLTGRPTLDKVEKKFERSREIRKTYRDSIKERIDKVLKSYQSISKNTFVAELQKRQVAVVFRNNEQGYTYGATFIDHRTKCAFNGSDLGKSYSAKELIGHFSEIDRLKSYLKQPTQTTFIRQPNAAKSFLEPNEQKGLLDIVLGKTDHDLPAPMGRPKKRRKGKKTTQDIQQRL
jgi:Relaxase/Mobilisation nuclease domain